MLCVLVCLRLVFLVCFPPAFLREGGARGVRGQGISAQLPTPHVGVHGAEAAGQGEADPQQAVDHGAALLLPLRFNGEAVSARAGGEGFKKL